MLTLKNASSFEAVVFDLDGTLIDSETLAYASFGYALEPFGIKVTYELMESLRGRSPDTLFSAVLSDSKARQIANERLNWHAIEYAHETPLFEGVEAMLGDLHSKEIPLALWTARDRASAEHTMKLLKIDGFFKTAVSACLVKNNKPHPEGLFLIAKTLQVNAEKMIHVGDHHHDVIGAKAAMATSVGVTWHKKDRKMWHEDPHHEFDCIKKFSNWVAGHFPVKF